jgi:hypothetical protein
MWTAVAMVAALSLAPGDSGALALTNVRATYGLLGAPRPDTKFLPGDQAILAFDIEGLQVDKQGRVLYRIAMEVADSDGKVQFKQAPRDQEVQNTLGGNSLPAFVSLNIGLDQPPGTYTVKVTVTDRAAKASKTLTQSCEVLPKAFGLVRLSLTGDAEGHVPAPVLGEGQSVWVNFSAVGFQRDEATKQPDLTVHMRVLDEEGRPTVAQPFAGRVAKDVPAKALALPMQFMLNLNRAGKFTVQLDATDKVSGQSAALSLPLVVAKIK